jgi:hypothetical protein
VGAQAPAFHNKEKVMPQYYSVLDNGQKPVKEKAMAQGYSERPGKGKKKQRKFVGKYLASKGVEKSPTGSRSKREMKLRAEGRAMFQAKKNKKSGSGASSKPPARTTGVAADRQVPRRSPAKPTGSGPNSRGRKTPRTRGPRGGM